MTDLCRAAEMALKVLKEINEISKAPMGLPLPAEIDNAMETLRQALAQPEWVGLTDEESNQIVDRLSSTMEISWGDLRPAVINLTKAVESQLKGKNT